jgi:hypothetical protein
MNNIKQTSHTPMFDGVYMKTNDATIYRIVQVTDENKKRLEKLIPKEYHNILSIALEWDYILENPNSAVKYQIISLKEFDTFTKLNKEDASKILSGTNC